MCVRIVHFGTLTRDCVFCVQMCLLRQRERERERERERKSLLLIVMKRGKRPLKEPVTTLTQKLLNVTIKTVFLTSLIAA